MAVETGKISILLLSEAITSPDEALRHPPPTTTRHSLKTSLGLEGEAFSKESPRKPPQWLKFLNDGLEEPYEAKGSHASAVVIIKVDGRYFAIPFGMGGRFLINERAIIKDFGMMVTLNSVDPDKVGVVESTTHTEGTQHRCLVAEVTYQGKTYVLSTGEWRLVSQSFADSVKNAISVFDANPPTLDLPAFDWNYAGKDKERHYNQSVVAANPTFAMLDGVQIGVAGTPAVNEPCDILMCMSDILK